MKFDSIKFEVSFLYTLILGIILTFFSGVLYVILSTTLYHELDYESELKAQEISNNIRAYADMHKKDSDAMIPAAETIITEEHKNLKWWGRAVRGSRWLQQVRKIDINTGYINFADARGYSLANSKNITGDLMALFLKEVEGLKTEEASFKDIIYNQHRIRLVNYPFTYNGQVYVVQVGISPPPMVQLLQGWLYPTMLSIPLVLILTSCVGWLFAKRFLKPVQKIIDTAQNITLQDLSARVPQEHYAIEMKSLIEAFNSMIARLEQSFKHIEEFSSHVAHELKTPLTIIRGETELALRRNSSEPEDYKEVLKVINDETRKMLKIIEDLLYLARLDFQSHVFEFTRFDFTGLLKEVYEQGKVWAAAKQLQIQAHLPEEPIMIKADPLYVRRLFLNLLDNAVKFTPSGGHIELSAKPENGQVVTTVSDSGVGIPEPVLPKIYDKLFRGDASQEGYGLGLSIVQAVVKIHKGHIDVQSKVKQGTTFKVTLPLAPPD
jgi:heavy metal sensor kinase